jgi:hypothetical protein
MRTYSTRSAEAAKACRSGKREGEEGYTAPQRKVRREEATLADQ